MGRILASRVRPQSQIISEDPSGDEGKLGSLSPAVGIRSRSQLTFPPTTHPHSGPDLGESFCLLDFTSSIPRVQRAWERLGAGESAWEWKPVVRVCGSQNSLSCGIHILSALVLQSQGDRYGVTLPHAGHKITKTDNRSGM